MKINQVSREQLIRIKGEYQAKYAMEMDDWTAMLLADANERFDIMGKKLDEANAEIRSSSNRLKGSVKTYQIKNKWDALWLGIGKTLLPSFIAFLFLILLSGYYYNDKKFKRNVDNLIFNKENKTEFQQFINNSNIKEDGKFRFLILKPANFKTYVVGNNYIYNSKENVVLIPLNK